MIETVRDNNQEKGLPIKEFGGIAEEDMQSASTRVRKDFDDEYQKQKEEKEQDPTGGLELRKKIAKEWELGYLGMFYDGIAIARPKEDLNGPIYYVKKSDFESNSAERKLHGPYGRAMLFVNGQSAVEELDWNWYIIDTDFKHIEGPIDEYIATEKILETERFPTFNESIKIINEKGNTYYKDDQGNVSDKFNYCSPFRGGFAIVGKGNNYFFINAKFQKVAGPFQGNEFSPPPTLNGQGIVMFLAKNNKSIYVFYDGTVIGE